jgi:hypothetical protein
MAQSTPELILEYGRTRTGTKEAHGVRKRIRRRARGGDALATRFLVTTFAPASVVGIERQLVAWLGRWT